MDDDVESNFNVENPLHTDNIPVAKLVQIEVEGQPVLEPKIINVYKTCEKVWDYIQISAAVLMLIGLFGGFILFAIWAVDPNVFGHQNADDK
jgi:hypothetical protein